MQVLAFSQGVIPSSKIAHGSKRSQCTSQAAHFAVQPLNFEIKNNSTSIARNSVKCSAASENGNGNGSAVLERTAPTAAETARTVVDLVAHGTLCTINEDGVPLGTYVSYVLDQEGQPILRLRADAVHTANLKRDGQCSLFVQPGEHPARLLARVTLIGKVEPVDEEVAQTAAELHNTLHAGGAGVDAPQPTDIYCRLVVDKCFYVGQLSGDSAADVISGDAYRAAEADPLRTKAANLAKSMNENRVEDVIRISSHVMGVPFEDLYFAELLWVDRLGAYIRAIDQEGVSSTVRVQFAREVDDDRGVQSALTMMAQVAWEIERPYQPVAVAASIDSA